MRGVAPKLLALGIVHWSRINVTLTAGFVRYIVTLAFFEPGRLKRYGRFVFQSSERTSRLRGI